MSAGDAGNSPPPPALGPAQVLHVAHLARLQLSEDELALFTEQLASVLDYAAEISGLDVAALEPMAHPLPLRNVLRDDEPAPCVEREVVLAEAPAVEDHRFKVPRILSEEG